MKVVGVSVSDYGRVSGTGREGRVGGGGGGLLVVKTLVVVVGVMLVVKMVVEVVE